jgi:hypothetical protein
MRDEEMQMFERRREAILRQRNRKAAPQPLICRLFPQMFLANRRSIIVTTAFSVLIGLFAYYYKTQTQVVNVDIIR